MTAASDAWAKRVDIAVIVAAVATVPLTILQVRGVTSDWIVAADWVVWSVFVLDFGIGISIERRFNRRQWFNLAIVITSFPGLPDLLALTRLARLTRLSRLVRLVAVFSRAVPALQSTLGRSGVRYVASLALVFVFVGGGLFFVAEPDLVGGFWSGVWWAIVTMTTVGYGDIAPESTTGRLIGVGLMMVGIGLLATISASVAAYFVESDSDNRLERIEAQLERIEDLLRK